MRWRLSARKGAVSTKSSSQRKELIERRAEKLRKAGWKVRVYQVKKSK